MVNLTVRNTSNLTYWEPTGTDVFGGDTFKPARQLKGRMEMSTEQIRDKRGEEAVVKAVVYLNEELDVNGYLYEGVSVATDPRTVEGASEIRQFGSIPSLRNLKKIWVAYL